MSEFQGEITDPQFERLGDLVVEILTPDIEHAGLSTDDFDIETDILNSGIIDSFGFLVLVSAFEERAGIKVSLEALNNVATISVKEIVERAMASA